MSIDWNEMILHAPSPAVAWEQLFSTLKDCALQNISPVLLHDQTVVPDRLLSEAAWELWHAYPGCVLRTSEYLKRWLESPSSTGKAVLILDALSLRELPYLLGGAQVHNIAIEKLSITGSECPSTTEQFAKALGVSSRSSLANDKKPGTFNLFGTQTVFTDVVSMPFEDCHVAPCPNIFIWHSWLDDLIHLQNKLPDQITTLASSVLQSDGFWKFINKLRQGRKLLITADHGYAVSKRFSSEVENADAIDILRNTFGASRCKAIGASGWEHRFMPPIVIEHNGHHVVMGQRKWKVQGGFPHICHGGMSLLEVAVPFVELGPL